MFFVKSWSAVPPATTARLGASLAGFTGSRAYDTRQLRADLDRSIFLLGGSDGERLSQPGQRHDGGAL